jgi:hypothetical protein
MQKYKLLAILACLVCFTASICVAKYRPSISNRLDYYVDDAANLNASTDNFDDILSSADDTVQKALDTLDDGAVNITGDTMTGDLQIKKTNSQYSLYDTTVDTVTGRWIYSATDGVTTLSALANKPGGDPGGGLRFNDGSNDEYLEVADDATFDVITNFSFATWINIKSLIDNPSPNVDIIAGRGGSSVGGWWLGYDESSAILKLTFGKGGLQTVITGTTGLSLDTWYLVGFTKSGDDWKIYINDSVEKSTTASGYQNLQTVLRLSNYYLGNYEIDAILDQVVFYGRTLAATDFEDMYNSGLTLRLNKESSFPQSETSMGLNLIMLLHLDETSGSSAADSSDNSNTGTLVNMEDGDWVTGIVAEDGEDKEINIISLRDGTNPGEAGIITIGQDSDNSPRIVTSGKTQEIEIGGTTRATWDANGTFTVDNGSAAAQQIIARAAVGVSENVTEVQDSTEAVRASVDEDFIHNVEAIRFDTTASQTMEEGLLRWNDDDKTLNLGMPGGQVVGQMFQEIFIPGRVKNETGGTLTNGTIVYINGVSGEKYTVAKADASTEALSAATIGFITEDIAHNALGHVTTFGQVRGSAAQPIDTSAFSSGDVLYLSETAGAFTNVKPASPAHMVVLGRVGISSSTGGAVLANIINGFEVFELHDVDDSLSSPVNRQLMFWNDSTSLWEQTDELSYDYSNDRLGVGEASPDTRLEVDGAITIQELSADPTDPTEGKAVFWMGDGTGTGSDGDLLYMEQSGSSVETGNLKWSDYTPSSITSNVSDGTSGSVSDVQTMFDGNVYQIEEATGVPGFDVEFVFSGLDKLPTFVVTRWMYDGSATHYVTWDIWNYDTTAWDTLRVFKDSDAYFASMTMYIPRANDDNYVSSGAAKIRVYHQTSGNAAHSIQVDYVGLTHSLQGVL